MPLNDSDRPDGDGRSAGSADTPTSPVGTVAEEAAKLVEMLAAAGGPWMGTGGPDAARSARGAARATESSDGAGPSGHEPNGDSRDRSAPGGPEAAGSRTCTCGGTPPQSCRLCPVCQVIAFVSSISPETIDRAADLVAFAAVALRDLATAQRERQGAEQPTRSPEDPS